MRRWKNHPRAPSALRPTTARACAYVKLERLRLAARTNHFSLKGRLYLKAMQAAFAELTVLKNQLSQYSKMELA